MAPLSLPPPRRHQSSVFVYQLEQVDDFARPHRARRRVIDASSRTVPRRTSAYACGGPEWSGRGQLHFARDGEDEGHRLVIQPSHGAWIGSSGSDTGGTTGSSGSTGGSSPVCLTTCRWDGVCDDCGIEGLSCILPMFVVMPLKYALGIAIAVRIVDLAHVVLFVAALVAALSLIHIPSPRD